MRFQKLLIFKRHFSYDVFGNGPSNKDSWGNAAQGTSRDAPQTEHALLWCDRAALCVTRGTLGVLRARLGRIFSLGVFGWEFILVSF